MRFLVIVVATASLLSCGAGELSTPDQGERFLAKHVPIGSSYASAKEALAAEGITFVEISPKDCGAAGSIYMFSEYVCEGGPALRATLSENAKPYNPFYSPSLHAFMAFTEERFLESVVVQLEGGD